MTPPEVIDKIYNKKGYLQLYGGSLLFTIIILFGFFIWYSYFHVMNQVEPIRADWLNQRCSPSVIPFAGYINGDPDKTAWEYTGENFFGCLSQILTMVSGYAFEPIYYLMNVLSEIFQNIVNAINSIRKMFDYMRSQMAQIFKEIIGKVLNFIVPILKMVIVLKDMISKSQGIMTGGLYTGLGVYMTLKAALGAILQLIIIILIVLAALIVVFWIVPFTWGLAAAMTAVFIAISVPLLIIMIFFMRTLDIHTDLQIPGVPSCFDPDTIIPLEKGLRRVKDVQIGDELSDGGIVTAIMKMSSNNQEMYKLNKIIVSGTHMVMHKGKWIRVAQHPKSILLKDYACPFIYCFNTTQKTVVINNTVFSDWDELNNYEIDEIRQKCKAYLPYNFHTSDIHKYLDSGFSEDTLIKTYYGEKVPISEIEINDILQFGEHSK